MAPCTPNITKYALPVNPVNTKKRAPAGKWQMPVGCEPRIYRRTRSAADLPRPRHNIVSGATAVKLRASSRLPMGWRLRAASRWDPRRSTCIRRGRQPSTVAPAIPSDSPQGDGIVQHAPSGIRAILLRDLRGGASPCGMASASHRGETAPQVGAPVRTNDRTQTNHEIR